MSGGRYNYAQYNINRIIEYIEEELDNQGKELPKEGLFFDEEHYKKYPEEKLYTKYSPEVQEKFKEGILALKKAFIYAQRIDWFLSFDDSEENFLMRLKEELEGLVTLGVDKVQKDFKKVNKQQ
jgi:sugar-specific transcriptional regulator TrmB